MDGRGVERGMGGVIMFSYKSSEQSNELGKGHHLSPRTIIGNDKKEIARDKSEKKWSDNVDVGMQQILNAMLLTPTGRRAYEMMKNAPTKISIKLVDGSPKAHYGSTYANRKKLIEKDGQYYLKEADIVIRKKVILAENSRFGSLLEGINAVASHEALHAADPEQLKKDIADRNGWETERTPIDTEIQSRIEFNELVKNGTIDLEKDGIPGEDKGSLDPEWLKVYETPGTKKHKKKGVRPAYFGLDEKGNSRTKSRNN